MTAVLEGVICGPSLQPGIGLEGDRIGLQGRGKDGISQCLIKAERLQLAKGKLLKEHILS